MLAGRGQLCAGFVQLTGTQSFESCTHFFLNLGCEQRRTKGNRLCVGVACWPKRQQYVDLREAAFQFDVFARFLVARSSGFDDIPAYRDLFKVHTGYGERL